MNQPHFTLDFAMLLIFESFFLLIDPKNFLLNLSFDFLDELIEVFFFDFFIA
jgi:hypothetical protein